MPLQDLTPALRTRLSRVEKTVGWFVTLATILLLAGFACYMYATARKRGWFVTKINYATSLNDATGFKPGDPVKLMGFPVGEVTQIVPNDPNSPRGLTIYFNIREPYYGYIWYDSHVRVVSDFLGNRYLEVEKGVIGQPTAFTPRNGELLVLNRWTAKTNYDSLVNELRTNSSNTNLSGNALLIEATNRLMELIKTQTNIYYTNAVAAGFTRTVDLSLPHETQNYCWIPSIDTPALGDRLNAVANQVELALPNILKLTNQLAQDLALTPIAGARAVDRPTCFRFRRPAKKQRRQPPGQGAGPNGPHPDQRRRCHRQSARSEWFPGELADSDELGDAIARDIAIGRRHVAIRAFNFGQHGHQYHDAGVGFGPNPATSGRFDQQLEFASGNEYQSHYRYLNHDRTHRRTDSRSETTLVLALGI